MLIEISAHGSAKRMKQQCSKLALYLKFGKFNSTTNHNEIAR